MSSTKRIDEMAEKATQLFLERNSVTYLECSVSLMLTHMSRERVAEILKQQAKIVEDFD